MTGNGSPPAAAGPQRFLFALWLLLLIDQS